jgi:peptide/nickel transport system ATP-binding protein
VSAASEQSAQRALLDVAGLRVTYPGRPPVRAVDGVDLTVDAGQVVGLVGESGCGKSTIARAICGLVKAEAGTVTFDGTPVTTLGLRRRPAELTRVQMVFQDPYASLHPRRAIGVQIGDGVRAAKARGAASSTPAVWLERVGLDPAAASRYPHEFSGGQRQRIAIARAVVLRPEVLVLDEPTSALDVSVQQQVLALLGELQRHYGMSYVFISHDLAVVRAMSHRVMVMKDGDVIEEGEAQALFDAPRESYTKALLAAAHLA